MKHHNDNSTSSSKLHTVTVLPDNDTPLDSVVKNIEYVKLKSTGNMLIGDISKIIVTDNHIIIVDTRQAQAVFVLRKAFTATPSAAREEPPLNPNHPNQSMAAPKITKAMFAGRNTLTVFRRPRKIAPVNAATPEEA